jgi:hypothetical protein
LRRGGHELILHLDVPWLVASHDDDPDVTKEHLSQYMLEGQPLLDSNFAIAARRAQMAMPDLGELEKWSALQEALWGGSSDSLGEIENSLPPTPAGYVYALQFRLERLAIAVVTDLDKESHLAFRKAHPEIDLLQLPTTGLSITMRVITRRPLVEYFEFVRATPIDGPPRGEAERPASSPPPRGTPQRESDARAGGLRRRICLRLRRDRRRS